MIALDTPIYDELAARHGIHIPDPFTSDPIAALAAGVDETQRLPVVRHEADCRGRDCGRDGCGTCEAMRAWYEQLDTDDTQALQVVTPQPDAPSSGRSSAGS